MFVVVVSLTNLLLLVLGSLIPMPYASMPFSINCISRTYPKQIIAPMKKNIA
jgi:hypothetical protein